MLEWLEYTSLSIWVAESIWGYPIMLSLHIIGLAVVVGIFTVYNFRLLGLFNSLEFEPFLDFFRLAWLGLLVNVVSGFTLFSSQATFYVTNIPFLVKIFSIIAGSLLAFKIQLRLQSNVNAWDETTAQPTNKDHSFAVISLALWTSAIFGGRLIAYL
jgi:ABC-type amino acid transport system permease subunit|tara:strand:- start:94 stop:564 length:471 start_codon:yes stop_codon:yes gene_type:complete